MIKPIFFLLFALYLGTSNAVDIFSGAMTSGQSDNSRELQRAYGGYGGYGGGRKNTNNVIGNYKNIKLNTGRNSGYKTVNRNKRKQKKPKKKEVDKCPDPRAIGVDYINRNYRACDEMIKRNRFRRCNRGREMFICSKGCGCKPAGKELYSGRLKTPNKSRRGGQRKIGNLLDIPQKARNRGKKREKNCPRTKGFNYVSRSKRKCKDIKAMKVMTKKCRRGRTWFENDCGCGCAVATNAPTQSPTSPPTKGPTSPPTMRPTAPPVSAAVDRKVLLKKKKKCKKACNQTHKQRRKKRKCKRVCNMKYMTGMGMAKGKKGKIAATGRGPRRGPRGGN